MKQKQKHLEFNITDTSKKEWNTNPLPSHPTGKKPGPVFWHGR